MRATITLYGLLFGAATLGLQAADRPEAPGATGPAAAAKVSKTADLFGEEVVARGKGVEVKRAELEKATISIKATANGRGQNIPPEQLSHLEQQMLQRLIQLQLLAGKASEEDLAKGKENSTKRFDLIKNRAGTDEALNRQLKSVGITQEELRKSMTDEAIAEAVIERSLKVEVNPEEIKKFYDENLAKFEQPEMVRASHILLSTRDSSGKELSAEQKAAKRKQMDELLQRARQGADFAQLAKEHSEDPESKKEGGEYTFARSSMVPAFETAAFSLKTNQVSEVVTTQYGYHIIKLSEKIPAVTASLEDEITFVRNGIKIKNKSGSGAADPEEQYEKLSKVIETNLIARERQKLLPEYLAKLKQEANVEILDERLKPDEAAGGASLPALAPPPPKAKDK